MKTTHSILKNRKIIALILCYIFCFSFVLFAVGCATGESTGDNYGVDSSTNGNIILKIDADGGSYSGYSKYIVKGNVGDIYELKKPTYSKSEYEFKGWLIKSGNGTINGNVFTFGTQDTEIKALWQEGAIENNLNVADYIKGATIIYKTSPSINNTAENIDVIKNQYISKITTIVEELNNYLTGEQKLTEEDATYKTILLNYLEEKFSSVITNSEYALLTETDKKIDYLIPYLDHFGLYSEEVDILINAISKVIGLDIMEETNKYDNRDGVEGFNAEKYNGYINTSTDVIEKSNIIDENYYQDLNNNGMFDLWTKETFIKKNLCTIDTYNYDDYHYALKIVDGKFMLDAKGLSGNQNYNISEFKLTLIGTLFKFYVFTNENGKIIESSGEPTDSVIANFDGINYYDANHNTISPIVVGVIAANVYTAQTGFLFDTVLDSSFQNYKNVIRTCVENSSNGWKRTSIAYLQQLDIDEMFFPIDNLDADFYENEILTNKSNSGLSIETVIIDVKQKVNIKSIQLFFEYLDEENLGATEITLHVGAQYYNKATQELKVYNDSNFKPVTITKSETQAVTENVTSSGDTIIGGVDIDFTKTYDPKGITLNPFETTLNNGNYISSNSVAYRTENLFNVDNYEDCFNVSLNSENNQITTYCDTSSDYLVLTFTVDKINGIAPAFKVCFFNFELAEAK